MARAPASKRTSPRTLVFSLRINFSGSAAERTASFLSDRLLFPVAHPVDNSDAGLSLAAVVEVTGSSLRIGWSRRFGAYSFLLPHATRAIFIPASTFGGQALREA